jgi:hypothetical protein
MAANNAQTMDRRDFPAAIIPNGTALSNGVQSYGATFVGLVTPAAWTAADITFDVSKDGTTWFPLFDNAGAEVKIPSASIPTGAGQAFALLSTIFQGWSWLRVRSGVSATPVNQAAARTVTLVRHPTAS